MLVAHLISSSFYGGPERQILGLARQMPEDYRTVFLLFSEGGRCGAFLEQVRRHGLAGIELMKNIPHVRAMAREIADHLRHLEVDILCCSGYKADLVGLPAARWAGIPVVSLVHGWTAATGKVRFYEVLDRLWLRWMDRAICVSEGQAAKVRRAGVPESRIAVIRNAIDAEPFEVSDPAYGERLRAFFPHAPARIVGAAGRLSPEKGYGVLVAAAAIVVRERPDVGFVHFGDGPLRADVARRIEAEGLQGRFVLGGFREDATRFFAHMDLFVLPSFTEGLPVVALEAYASGVPVVATAVGGNPEVVADGVDGYLAPPGDPGTLAGRILDALADEGRRRDMGQRGRRRILEHFTVRSQEVAYRTLFEELTRGRKMAVTS
mgnify:CR=1 FL=1